jgi:hypothetical protein
VRPASCYCCEWALRVLLDCRSVVWPQVVQFSVLGHHSIPSVQISEIAAEVDQFNGKASDVLACAMTVCVIARNFRQIQVARIFGRFDCSLK